MRAAVRSQGIGSLEDVDAVVLETDGTVTVLKKAEEPDGHSSSLKNVAGLAAATQGG